MGAAENKELVRAYFQAVSDGRPAEAWDMLADDALWIISGHSPLTGSYTREQLARNTEDVVLAKLKDGIALEVKNIIAEGDLVAVEFTSHGECKDGRIYDNAYHYLITVKDGKLWRCNEYLDTYHYADVILDDNVLNTRANA
jgi:ketosteroid isomerase-like protein